MSIIFFFYYSSNILFCLVVACSAFIQLMDTRSPVNAVHDNIISKLEVTFSESLHIHDAQNSEHASEGDHIGNCAVGEVNLRGGFELQKPN